MSKLTKFLDSNSEFITSSESGSLYYRIGNKKIRIANHLIPTHSQFALNILIPNNSRTQYILAINNKVFIYNSFTELKPFLINWCIIIKSSADIVGEISNSTKLQDIERYVGKLEKEIITLKKEVIVKQSPFDIALFTEGQQKQILGFIKQRNKK